MLKQGIRNIIFDLGGVLINLNRERCINNFRKLGFHHIEELIDPFRQEGVFMELESGAITTEEFRDRIRKEIDKPLSDQQIDDAWNSFLAEIPTYKLDALLKFKEKYTIYLLSNTNQIHWDWCCQTQFAYKGYTEKDFFEQIFLSFELHQTKPGAGIFQTVLNKTDLLPEETLFIDDSQANCETAEILGLSTYTPQAGEDWRHLFK